MSLPFYLRPLHLRCATTLRHLDQILTLSITSGDLSSSPVPSTLLLPLYSSLLPATSPSPSPFLLRLFFSVSCPDLFLFNTLLRSIPSPPLSLISSFSYLRLNSFTYSHAAKSLSSLPSARALHAHVITDGFSRDPFVASSLTHLYCKLSWPEDAQHVFDEIPDPDTVLYNTLLSGLASNGAYLESVMQFRKMLYDRIARPNSGTIAAVLPALAEMQDLKLGMELHCLGVVLGLVSDPYLVTGLVSMYSKCGDVFHARFLFDEMTEHDLVAWNAIISGYSSNNLVEYSVGMFKDLLTSGWRPNSSTMTGLIPGYLSFEHEGSAKSIHGFCIKSGLDLCPLVSTAITTLYCRLSDMESAWNIFDGVPEKSTTSWNALICGYTQNGLTKKALSLFRAMQDCNVRPNPITVTSILSACAQLGALSLGKWVHQIIIEEKIELNVYVLTSLVDMYAKCGSIVAARKIFDTMPERNVVSWNAMILGYGVHGQGREALNVYMEMLKSTIVPTKATFLSALYACSHNGLLEEGRSIFKSMTRDYGVKPGQQHYTCMVDLLGRAGEIKEAFEFIKKCPDSTGPGVWGALLGACKIHKETNLAKLAYSKLLELEPDNPGYRVLLSNIYSSRKNYAQAAMVRTEAKSRRVNKPPGCTLIENSDVPHVFTSGDRTHPRAVEIYQMLEKMMSKMVEAGYKPEADAAFYDVEEEEKELMVRVHSEKLAIAFGLISTEPGSEIRIIKNLRICSDCHNACKYLSKIMQRLIVARDATRFHHFRDGVCSCDDYW